MCVRAKRNSNWRQLQEVIASLYLNSTTRPTTAKVTVRDSNCDSAVLASGVANDWARQDWVHCDSAAATHIHRSIRLQLPAGPQLIPKPFR